MASAQIQSFIDGFYKLSDSHCEPSEYADAFADDGKLDGFAIGPMPMTKAKEGIVAWRSKAWDVVTSRHHRVLQVFPKADDPHTLVLLGDLTSDKKDGGKMFATWAGHMKLDKDAKKITYYKVWLVSSTGAARNS